MTKVAGIQFNCTSNKEENIERAKKLIAVASTKDAKLACFHEMFNLFWFPGEEKKEYFDLAEEINGNSIAQMQKLAKIHGMSLVCPFFEVSKDTYYNSAAVINEMGEIIGVYRKNHIPNLPLWHESFYFSRGDLRYPVFDMGFMKVGIQICWDNFYPEGARILALKGANMILAPTAAAMASQQRWKLAVCSNALFNNIYMMRINRCGSEPSLDFYGESFSVSPEGNIVDGPTDRKDGVLFMDVDLRFQAETKRKFSFIKQRRPEIYSEIVQKYQGLELINTKKDKNIPHKL